jgi:hypothetical protein
MRVAWSMRKNSFFNVPFTLDELCFTAIACHIMPPHRRILVMALSTGIIAALAASLSIEWMRYLLVVLIGVVAALFWQVNEIREEAERRVIRAMSHHLNNSLNIVMNRRHLPLEAREQIVDEQVLRCVWAIQTILPSLSIGLPELLNFKRTPRPNFDWEMSDIQDLRRHQPPVVH